MTGYIYDGDGNRVAKGSISTLSCDSTSNGFTLSNAYTVGPSGEQLDEADATGTEVHSNTFANGQLLSTYDNITSEWTVALNDWLGTKRVQVDPAIAANLTSFTSLTYGDALTPGGYDATEQHFTGKERDQESGNDYFGARYYGSSMGRFMSPDPSGGSLTNPQSLNRYSYGFNNPLTNTDPTGMYVCSDGKDGACTSDQDKAFENSLNGLRGSSNADVARAAAAYGAAGAVNGVSVGFADLSKSGEDGKVTSSLGVDANGNLQAQSNVTISTAASGASYDAAVGHEGSHVADAQDVVKSIVVDPATGNFTVGNNITSLPIRAESLWSDKRNLVFGSASMLTRDGSCDLA